MTDPIEPGSVALKPRPERFCQILANDGGTFLDAYLRSTKGHPPEATPGRRVSASRMAARLDVRDRIAFLRREAAKKAAEQPAELITTERLQVLMEDVTASLMGAAIAASNSGNHGTGQAIRGSITVHAGRSARVVKRTPAPERMADSVDLDGALERLHYCCCHRDNEV